MNPIFNIIPGYEDRIDGLKSPIREYASSKNSTSPGALWHLRGETHYLSK